MFFENPFDSMYIISILCYKDQIVCLFGLLFSSKGFFSFAKWDVFNVVNYLIVFVSSLLEFMY